VVLAQLGGPATLSDVEPFIEAVFSDPAVVPVPGGPRVRRAFAKTVAKTRGRSVRRKYAEIGGGSPIGATTVKQAAALEQEIRARGFSASVEVAFRCTNPSAADALRALEASGARRLVMVPLYPQFSEATTGSAETELRRAMAELGDSRPLLVVRSWCEHPTYLDALARLVTETFALVPADLADRTVVVLSAHGMPERAIANGDPYADEVAATVAGVVARLDDTIETTLSYQSRVGPMRWIGPDTTDVVADLGASGCKAIVVLAVSFVSDHLETLHELDIELRQTALEAGIEVYHRVPAFNDGPDLAPILVDVLEPILSGGTQ